VQLALYIATSDIKVQFTVTHSQRLYILM